MKKAKKFVLAIIVAMTANIAVAQSTKIHVVERGETIESIAQKYGVTKDAIVKLNPDAAQFVYVGMELAVPVPIVATSNVTKPDNEQVESEELSQDSKSVKSKEEIQSTNSHEKSSCCEYEVFAGLSINGFVGSDANDFNTKCGFNVGVSGRYYILDNFFAEASLAIATKGYQYDSVASSGPYWDDEGGNFDGEVTTKYTSYNIDVPILLGYKVPVNDDLSLKIKAGPYLTYALSGKETEKGFQTIYEDIHSSETEHIDEETKIGDMNGFKNFGYGVQAGISVDYKKYILSAYYQRGLSKVFDENKAYEQNILVSIGYRF